MIIQTGTLLGTVATWRASCRNDASLPARSLLLGRLGRGGGATWEELEAAVNSETSFGTYSGSFDAAFALKRQAGLVFYFEVELQIIKPMSLATHSRDPV